MGYTNKTTHYELPQYVATDKPKYLTDFNETMAAIDTQMYTNAQAAATADSKAVSAQSTADGAVSSIGTLNTQINGDPQEPSDTGLAGQVSDIATDLDTVQSLIGSGKPTTSNQTIIGAINGLESAVAPREDGDDLANSYSTGDQFARGGSVYEALTSLTAGTAFASLTLNTDYKVADTLVKQIADNAEAIANLESGYVLVNPRETFVSVSADGIKTCAALMEELRSAFLNFCQGLDAGIVLLADTVRCVDTYSVSTNKGLYGANTTSVSIEADMCTIDSTGALEVRSVAFNQAHAYRTTVKIANDGTVTNTDKSSDVPASGTFTISGMRFKSIS